MADEPKKTRRVLNTGDQPITIQVPVFIRGEFPAFMGNQTTREGVIALDMDKTEVLSWPAYDKAGEQPFLDLTEAQYQALIKLQAVKDARPRPKGPANWFDPKDIKPRGLLDDGTLRVQPI